MPLRQPISCSQIQHYTHSVKETNSNRRTHIFTYPAERSWKQTIDEVFCNAYAIDTTAKKSR